MSVGSFPTNPKKLRQFCVKEAERPPDPPMQINHIASFSFRCIQNGGWIWFHGGKFSLPLTRLQWLAYQTDRKRADKSLRLSEMQVSWPQNKAIPFFKVLLVSTISESFDSYSSS